MEKVLITGISGGQGRLLARRLLEKYEVCGVDVVEPPQMIGVLLEMEERGGGGEGKQESAQKDPALCPHGVR